MKAAAAQLDVSLTGDDFVMRLVVGLALSISLPAFASAQESSSTASVPEVTAVGTAEIRVSPDRAVVSLAVVTRGRSAATAARSNAERMTALLAALRRQSIPDSSVVTSGFSVALDEPYDEPARREPAQYTARNGVQVTLTQLEAVGALLDTALAAGATAIEDIVFRSSREPAARDSALARAVRNARADAQMVAGAASHDLGKLLEIVVEPNRGVAGGRVAMLSQVVVAGRGATPVIARDIAVSAQVRMRWALLAR
jgi:hypothetical protein